MSLDERGDFIRFKFEHQKRAKHSEHERRIEIGFVSGLKTKELVPENLLT
jgi:hypothetical protein